MTALLGYVPFLEPLNAIQPAWPLLIIPLSFGISVIYKAMRMPELDGFWRQVTVMTTQIVVAMVALAAFAIGAGAITAEALARRP